MVDMTSTLLFVIVGLVCLIVALLVLRAYTKNTPPPSVPAIKNSSDDDVDHQEVERIGSTEDERLLDHEEKIIGVAEPVGFWTKMVLAEKMDHLLDVVKHNKAGNKIGFWTAYVTNREAAKKKQSGKGF